MAPSSPTGLAAMPPSVAEWEDLLLRMEVMQRVLRNTLEEVPAGDSRATEVMEALVHRESEMGAWLERVSGVGRGGSRPAAEDSGDRGLRALADHFVSCRARNFAMLQRRGLEVWRWTGDFSDHGTVSAFQVITWLVAQDVRALAALRERAGSDTGSC